MMKKRILATAVCLVLAAGGLMTGCGSGKTETVGETVKKESKEITTAQETKDTVAGGEESSALAADKKEISSTSAAGHDYSSYQPEKDTYNLVFIPKLVHEWYEDVKVGIDEAAAELKEQGITVNYTWDAPAQAVVTDQISKMESAASSRPDGISLAIIDPSATTPVINELIAAGLKVSTFDCDAPDSDRLYYCGHSANYQDGYDIAKILADSIGGKGQVAILAGSLSAANHQDRVKGFEDCMKENYPDIEIVDTQADEDSVEKALSITEGYLSTYPELKGIYGCNGAAPNGAARAVKDAGKSGQIPIVGMAEDEEALNYVKEGAILCTMVQNVTGYGYNSVYNMIMLADGKAPQEVNMELPATFVTKDNIDQFLK